MDRRRRYRLPAVLGVVAVVCGVLVLNSKRAANVGVDPLSDSSQTRGWLDNLSAWNSTREVGGVLIVLGLTLLALALGLLLGALRQSGSSGRLGLVITILAGTLLVGGVTGFAYLPEPEVTYVGIYRLVRTPVDVPPVVLATMVWSRSQVVCALAAATGLLLAGASAGLVTGRRRSRQRSGVLAN